VVHRDLKPENVMVDRQGKPLLMDFGLARRYDGGEEETRITQEGMIRGTPAYMSPEQVHGRLDVGPASDVYSLGVMLYEMLAGELPFRGPMSSVFGRVLTEVPPPPSGTKRPGVGPELDAICARMLEKKPEDRYPSMREVAGALAAYLRGSADASTSSTKLPAPAPTPPVTEPPAAPPKSSVANSVAEPPRPTVTRTVGDSATHTAPSGVPRPPQPPPVPSRRTATPDANLATFLGSQSGDAPAAAPDRHAPPPAPRRTPPTSTRRPRSKRSLPIWIPVVAGGLTAVALVAVFTALGGNPTMLRVETDPAFQVEVDAKPVSVQGEPWEGEVEPGEHFLAGYGSRSPGPNSPATASRSSRTTRRCCKSLSRRTLLPMPRRPPRRLPTLRPGRLCR
jgi:serine/threonine-protein kinase